MNTKYLMITSALSMCIAGVLLTFFPDEILDYSGITSPALAPLFLQILGALYFSFALLNWMAKGNLMGGIYSKPVSMANFAHFFIGALTLMKEAFANPDIIVLWIVGIIYSIFAVFFSITSFGSIKTE